MKAWIVKRLLERSTWLGLIALATLFGVNLSEEQKDLIVQVGVAATALVLTFTADRA